MEHTRSQDEPRYPHGQASANSLFRIPRFNCSSKEVLSVVQFEECREVYNCLIPKEDFRILAIYTMWCFDQTGSGKFTWEKGIPFSISMKYSTHRSSSGTSVTSPLSTISLSLARAFTRLFISSTRSCARSLGAVSPSWPFVISVKFLFLLFPLPFSPPIPDGAPESFLLPSLRSAAATSNHPL